MLNVMITFRSYCEVHFVQLIQQPPVHTLVHAVHPVVQAVQELQGGA